MMYDRGSEFQIREKATAEMQRNIHQFHRNEERNVLLLKCDIYFIARACNKVTLLHARAIKLLYRTHVQ